MSIEFSLAREPSDTPNLENSENRVAELKYDGTRIAFINKDGKQYLRNRSDADKTLNFREIADVEIPSGTVLDGEVIVATEENPAGDFNQLLKRSNTEQEFRQKVLSKKVPAKFIVFDVLKYRGEDVTDQRYTERRELVKQIVEEVDSDRLAISRKWSEPQEGWEYAVENDLEGVIIKETDSRYISGRTDVWQKVKTFQEEEMTAVEYEEHNKGVTVETDDGVRLTVNGDIEPKKVASTIDDKGEVDIEVGYLEETKNGDYRHPTYRGMA